MARVSVPLTAQAVTELVGGRLVGEGTGTLRAVGPLEGADGATLSLLTSTRYLPEFRTSGAGAVLLKPEAEAEPAGPPVRIVVSDPQGAMARVLGVMFPPAGLTPGVDPTATLGRGVRLGPGVSIGPRAVLGEGVGLGAGVRLGPGVVLEAGVTIGDGSELQAYVVCHQGTRIGRRCFLKAGTVVGGAGFGYISGPDGHRRIPHIGGCILGDEVEIGANCCVDRGSIDDTVIGAGTKLDNHVHIGHNARVGERCLIMGGCVLAGSAELGNGVIVAGHTAIAGHFRVGDRARIGAKSGVISAVPDGTDVTGFPARPHREFLKAQAALYRLAKITDDLEALVRPRSGKDA
ncbi:MAG TPA: UDP-3-O-(3-hydroxymyristoyl)glucosamine N-acyltransferase [Gemmatimonadales bacterium]|nr:UDP-3-O-(3-hydroxymyristoyl)glucosamine N-acyltransferase [Gemmatimonadales bacterium]